MIDFDDGCTATIIVFTDGAYIDVELTPTSFIAQLQPLAVQPEQAQPGVSLNRVIASQVPTHLQYEDVMSNCAETGEKFRCIQFSLMNCSFMAKYDWTSLLALLRSSFDLSDAEIARLNVSIVLLSSRADGQKMERRSNYNIKIAGETDPLLLRR